MVRARQVVPQRLRRPGPQKDRSRVADGGQQGARVRSHDLQVLRGDLIGQLRGLFQVPAHDGAAEVPQGALHDLRAAEVPGLPDELGVHRLCQRGAGGQQHGGGQLVVLRLAQQVGGHILGPGGLVRDDQHLRGAGHHVDVQRAVGHTLGGGHIGVARSHQLIHPGNKARAIGERRHRLGAAHGDHPVHPGDLCRGQHGVVQIPRRRGDHHDFLHPGHLGGHCVHQHGGGIGRRPAGHIDAHPLQPPYDAADHAAVGRAPLQRVGEQLFVVVPDVGRGVLQGRDQRPGAGGIGRVQLLPADLPRLGVVKAQGVVPHG